jgi:hypothetical protein
MILVYFTDTEMANTGLMHGVVKICADGMLVCTDAFPAQACHYDMHMADFMQRMCGYNIFDTHQLNLLGCTPVRVRMHYNDDIAVKDDAPVNHIATALLRETLPYWPEDVRGDVLITGIDDSGDPVPLDVETAKTLQRICLMYYNLLMRGTSVTSV